MYVRYHRTWKSKSFSFFFLMAIIALKKSSSPQNVVWPWLLSVCAGKVMVLWLGGFQFQSRFNVLLDDWPWIGVIYGFQLGLILILCWCRIRNHLGAVMDEGMTISMINWLLDYHVNQVWFDMVLGWYGAGLYQWLIRLNGFVHVLCVLLID